MDRRSFLGLAAVPLAPAFSHAAKAVSGLRGSLDASQLGVRPGSASDQAKILQRAVNEAAGQKRPLFLPPGRYIVSSLTLPANSSLIGVPGTTQIVHAGTGPVLSSSGTRNVSLEGLVIDGSIGVIPEPFGGLVQFTDVALMRISGCEIIDSRKSAITLSGCGGWIKDNVISGALDYAVYCLDAAGLSIQDNEVTDCADGGILVHRRKPGEDGTIVSGNRVQRIGARSGGTGPWGNGINVFQGHSVIVANNRVSDCAFSAIRSNGGSNLQIIGNNCLRSGETALYSEFTFQGAIIANNVVDGAAHGISIANSNEDGRMAVCTGNLVRNIYTKGPYPPQAPGFGTGIWVEAETAVTGNVIERAPLFGLALGWGPFLRNVSATGNIIRNAGVGIAVTVVEGAGKAVISNNIISDTPRGAIVGFRWSDRVTKDLAITGAKDWPHLSLSNNL